jgi:hypothetical protein
MLCVDENWAELVEHSVRLRAFEVAELNLEDLL